MGVVNKILEYCGFNTDREYDDANQLKIKIWHRLVKLSTSCFAEALPLDLLEQLQDILNDYQDDPLGYDEGWRYWTEDIQDSEGELEDEVDEYFEGNNSYWGRINGSMELERSLGLRPFGQETNLDVAILQLDDDIRPLSRLQNGGLAPSLSPASESVAADQDPPNSASTPSSSSDPVPSNSGAPNSEAPVLGASHPSGKYGVPSPSDSDSPGAFMEDLSADLWTREEQQMNEEQRRFDYQQRQEVYRSSDTDAV